MDNSQRVEVLIHALPYIKKYSGKIIVIKYGGHAMVDEEIQKQVMSDIILLTLIGVKVVLVHGGGPEITQMLNQLGKETKFINGLRYTDEETVEIVQMVLAGKINKNLVNIVNSLGGHAVGLCGIDGQMIVSKSIGEEYGFVGDIVNINDEILYDLLDKGYIPVISSLGCDKDGKVYNINADTVAARLAGKVNAESLISMTDICGILKNQNDKDSLISSIAVSDAPQLIREGIISGGMIPKVDCCIEAIRRGVKRAFILDGTVPHAILMEILTDEGIGTMFYGE